MKIIFVEQVNLCSESESRQHKQPEDLYSGNLKMILWQQRLIWVSSHCYLIRM